MKPAMIGPRVSSTGLACLLGLLLTPHLGRGESVPDPARGLYAIWSPPEITDRLPFLKGDQVRLQWRDVQPAADRYDFTALDAQLERVAKLGRFTTVQLNANRHPEFLRDLVPAYKGALKRGETDRLLQYWHPAYVRAYTDLIAAFARSVKTSPYRASVLGVRLNYNAIGTEFLIVRPEERDPEQWSAPAGIVQAPPWTEEIATEYRRRIVAAFLDHFNPELRVLLRTGNPLYPGPDPDIPRLFGTGNVGVFTTASEIEPRLHTWFQGDRPIFLDYCRSGTAVGYAESMADATGKHGPAQDPRWCPPAQYNYWRLLSDLNLGFSMIGVYGSDLARADDPEFRAAFDFAARYAGYHASPSVAPGGWVALREEGLRYKDDYTFLMRRVPGTALDREKNVGPADQRFGAWAATFRGGGQMAFALDAGLARSLEGRGAVIRVIYLDRGAGEFHVAAPGAEFHQKLAGTGRWQTMERTLDPIRGALAPIAIKTECDLTLHMIEVARSQ
jgi:hypothetical protein